MITIFKNKKADASVTILVFLTLALCVVTLFWFYVSEKNRETEIITFGTLNDFYTQEEATEYFLQEVARDIILNDSSISSEVFLTRFRSGIVDSFQNINVEVYHQMRTNNFDVKISGKTLYFTMQNFTFTKDYERKAGGIYNVVYKKDLSFETPIL